MMKNPAVPTVPSAVSLRDVRLSKPPTDVKVARNKAHRRHPWHRSEPLQKVSDPRLGPWAIVRESAAIRCEHLLGESLHICKASDTWGSVWTLKEATEAGPSEQ